MLFARLAGRIVSRRLGLFGVALVFCLIGPRLFSQTIQSNIQGEVFDQSGGAIAGATVTVTDVARGISRVLVTDSTGGYVAINVIPGAYTVRAEAKGFRPAENNSVQVEVTQTVRVDMVLQPGEQTQTVTVTSEAATVNTTDAVLGGTVSNQAINELPLNGRNFERLLQLRPAVYAAVGAGTGVTTTNGRHTQNDLFRLDGIAGISQTTGSAILNNVYHGGDSSSLVPIDAIQEFSSEQMPKAQDGFRDGSVVNVGIKSGTNGIHGTAYAFGRDASATDAANFFGGVTPATLEQFGATVGGPILKNKLFWFASAEFLRDYVGDVVTTDTIPSDILLPTSADPTSQFSLVNACQFLGPAKINALSAQLVGLNPTTCAVSPASSTVENVLPYNTAQPTGANPHGVLFAPGIPSSFPLNNGLFKADYVFSEHNHFSGMFYESKSTAYSSAGPTSPSTPSAIEAQWGITAPQFSRQISGDWVWTPNSTWVNDLRAGYVYVVNNELTPDGNMLASSPWPSGYGMPTGVTNTLYGGFPEIQVTGFTLWGGGGDDRTGRAGPEGDFDLVESVSHLRGNHDFKAGFEDVDMVFDLFSFGNAQGTAVFSSLQNYLQGIPTSGSIFVGNPQQHDRYHWYAAYLQDDWRATSRVTLNLGLRYEYYTPGTERNNYIGNFNPNVNPATTSAVQQYGPGAPLSSEFNAGWGYLSPRLGVAWDVRGNGKTVVRAGGGAFTYSQVGSGLMPTSPFGANIPSIGVNNSGTDINSHNSTTFTLGACATSVCPGQWNWNLTGVPIFPTANQVIVQNGVTYTGQACTIATPCQTGGVASNYRAPYTVEWNLDVQEAITNNLTADVAYVGNQAAGEGHITDLNQPPIGTGWDTSAVGACLGSAAANYNKCTPDTAMEAAKGLYRATFPYLNQIDLITTTPGAFSNYNALQATIIARAYRGLSFLSGYVYSHSLATPGGGVTNSRNVLPSDGNNLRLNYGSSSTDLRQRFTFSPTYLIPGMKSPGQMLQGWSVNAILTLQSGLHWTPSDATRDDLLGTGENTNAGIGGGVTQYWNYSGPRSAFAVTGPNAIPCYGKYTGCVTTFIAAPAAIQSACLAAAQAPYAGNTTLQQLAVASLYNGACYIQNGGVLTPPAYGTLGDATPGIFAGPNYRNVDFSVAKLWKWKERYSAQFRAEFFNFFNHSDFAAPGADPTTPSSFGHSQNTPDSSNPVLGSGGPRHVQFGLKLTF